MGMFAGTGAAVGSGMELELELELPDVYYPVFINQKQLTGSGIGDNCGVLQEIAFQVDIGDRPSSMNSNVNHGTGSYTLHDILCMNENSCKQGREGISTGKGSYRNNSMLYITHDVCHVPLNTHISRGLDGNTTTGNTNTGTNTTTGNINGTNNHDSHIVSDEYVSYMFVYNGGNG